MKTTQELLKIAEVKAERWKIAYEVLEEESRLAQQQSETLIETLLTTISSMLNQLNKKTDQLLEYQLASKSKPVDNSGD